MKRVREVVSDLMILAGAGVLVYAAFLIHPIAGFVVSGVVLIGLGVVVGKEASK